MKMKILLRFFILILLLKPWVVEASSFRGARQMGMGGAAIGVVNDETSLLSNPAGLGKLRDFIFTVADPEIEIGSGAYSVARLNAMNTFDPQKTLDMINEKHAYGVPMSLRGQVFPSFVVPNFGVGLFAKQEVFALVDEEQENYRFDYFKDYAFVMGFNLSFWDGRIKLGFNGRVVNRSEVREDELSPEADDLVLDDMIKEGIGVASDIGLILTAPWAWLPSVSAVLRDAGGTSYNARRGLFKETELRPQSTNESLDVAVALFPILGNYTRASWTAEYRDILTASEEKNAMRRFHTGVEFNFYDAFFVRAGMNQMYWTAGLELALRNYQLQLASYGEEVGLGEDKMQDRRYIFKFAYRF